MADTVNTERAARDSFQFTGEGELVRLVNELDWENTPMGAIGTWPESVRGAVSIALESTLQMAILAGPELTYIYNDAYKSIFGDKHPQALGKSLWTVWPEATESLEALLSPVIESGRAVRHDDMPLLLERHGYPEECYFTFSYSALRTGDRIDGVFVSALETSERVIYERRLRTLGALATCVASLRGENPYGALVAALGANRHDIPCAALYLADAGAAEARLMLQTADSEHAMRLCEAVRDDTEASAQSPVARALATGLAQEFDAAAMLAPGKNARAAPEAPRRAIAFPLVVPGERRPRAVFVVAANPRQALDAAQRTFLDFVAGHVTTAIANLEAERIERERLAAMEALDRQKSQFFADASHELRTPLALILGPLESLLHEQRGQLPPGLCEPLLMARRNAQRMKRLVNSMLDFARIEGGAAATSLAPVDLSALTLGIAAMFRSAFAASGVEFAASVPARPVSALADPEMWEKIVVNLLSNALKFTPAGRVEVLLEEEGAMVLLAVRDTGTGIAQQDLPHIFDRFYRGRHDSAHAEAEGSGLGLAMVAQLARLMGGSVQATSEQGTGSCFTVRIAANGAAAAESAAPWPLPAARAGSAAIPADALLASAGRAGQGAGLHQVLVIDDNEDIVLHLKRVLEPEARIESAGNALAGLDAIRRLVPDIVLLDVMMPGMSGFELLRIIRADDAIQSIPVIVLSAHAGEEARLEALAAGADDYMVKPFSARELAAMVRSHISLVRIRRSAVEREARLLTEIDQARNDLESIIERTSDAFVSVDHDMRVVALNDVTARILERDRAALVGLPLLEMEPDAVPVCEALRSAMAGKRTVGLQYLHRPSGRWFAVRCYPSRHGAITLANEITRQKRAEARLQLAHAELELRVERRTRDLNSANALLEAVFDRAPVATAMSDMEGRILRANAAYASLVGASPALLRGLGVDHFVHPDDLAQKRARLQQLVAGEGPGTMLEMRYRREGGREIWVENFAAVMHDEDGRPQFVVEIVQDITARKRAADEVLASRNELRWLYDWLQRVRREERIALAREVHDQLGQILSAAKIDIKLLLEDVQASRSGLPRRKLLAELRSATTTLDQAIESARSIATELRPPEIENQGLYAAIAWHSNDFERRTRVNLHVALPAPKGGPSGAAAVTLFRIFKEALTNIVRHARATTVWISVHRRGAFLFLRVRDNGVGIAPERVHAAGTLGLVGMRERAQLARGRVAIRALASGGTLVSAAVPAPEQGTE
ncbi:MAG: ATP-binding protein [Telluria sp.]